MNKQTDGRKDGQYYVEINQIRLDNIFNWRIYEFQSLGIINKSSLTLFLHPSTCLLVKNNHFRTCCLLLLLIMQCSVVQCSAVQCHDLSLLMKLEIIFKFL